MIPARHFYEWNALKEKNLFSRVDGKVLYLAGFYDLMEKEIRVYDLLDSLQIDYQRVDHEAAMNMEVCEAIDAALQATICKNLFMCPDDKNQVGSYDFSVRIYFER